MTIHKTEAWAQELERIKNRQANKRLRRRLKRVIIPQELQYILERIDKAGER